MLQTHLYCISSDGSADARQLKELIKSNPDETEIRSFLVNGDQVSVTLRIPDTLRDAAKEEAALRGMSCAHVHDRRAREEGGIEA